VTGDGVRDRISLTGRWARNGCRFWLRVNGGAPLRLREGLLEAPRVSPMARIAGLRGAARVDSRPGAEILVTLNRSASGEGVGVYAFRRERLRYMSIEGRNRIDGIFWHNVAGLGGTRAACWRRPASGFVVTMSYVIDSSGRGADIHRRLWRADGLRFRPVWSRDYRRTRRTFPEQRTPGPFGNCLTRS
jgi:hypothetical protein